MDCLIPFNLRDNVLVNLSDVSFDRTVQIIQGSDIGRQVNGLIL